MDENNDNSVQNDYTNMSMSSMIDKKLSFREEDLSMTISELLTKGAVPPELEKYLKEYSNIKLQELFDDKATMEKMNRIITERNIYKSWLKNFGLW